MRQESTGIKTLTELSLITLARSIKRCNINHEASHVLLKSLQLRDASQFAQISTKLLSMQTKRPRPDALHTGRTTTLEGLPEELALELLELVLSLGLLTPKVLEMFERLGHTEVDIRITELNIQELPLLLPTTRNRWLGD